MALVLSIYSACALGQAPASDSQQSSLDQLLGSAADNTPAPAPAPASSAAATPAPVAATSEKDQSAASAKPVNSANNALTRADQSTSGKSVAGATGVTAHSSSHADGASATISNKPVTQKAKRNPLIEEIVVTAEKRQENLEDVPISVAAFSGAALKAEGITEPKDLAQSISGVYYGQTVNFAIIYIRGVGTDAFLPDSDPSVATYVDGIYFPFANGLSQAFGAIQRIEVLKGP
ncbi:MAG: TonB-dependent receptor plug domain-containing protein, partial [Candidatus Micrarchaeaceae archaeon]